MIQTSAGARPALDFYQQLGSITLAARGRRAPGVARPGANAHAALRVRALDHEQHLRLSAAAADEKLQRIGVGVAILLRIGAAAAR